MDAELKHWLRGDDTGLSSKTLASVMEPEIEWMNTRDHPLDPADLGRCIRLLDIMPHWKQQLHKMAEVSIEWQVLIDNWDELAALYNEEYESGYAPKCYARMRELLDPIYEIRSAAWRRKFERR